MRVRLALAFAALSVAAGATVASAGVAKPADVYVGTQNGGVQVGSSVGGQPAFGAQAGPSGVCVGFSYQIPVCLPLSLT